MAVYVQAAPGVRIARPWDGSATADRMSAERVRGSDLRMGVRAFVGAGLAAALLLVAGCAAQDRPAAPTGERGRTGPDGVREYRLIADETVHELKPGVRVEAWAFNGTVPGPELRMRQNERVRVVVENRLPEPISIHWHGLPVPNGADGVPGITQNAIKPGETYAYEFTVLAAGTYWYHSHQRSVEQVDRGLHGALIVEPAEEPAPPNRDVVLMLDEWMSGAGQEGMMPSSGAMMSGGHGGHGAAPAEGAAMPMGGVMPTNPEQMHERYDVFTINGKAGDAVPALEVRQGERVRIRLSTRATKRMSCTCTVTVYGGAPL